MRDGVRKIRTDVAVIGGGLGACAAALAAASLGRRVVLTEQTHWVGGQLTSQAVPPDEHPWIETFGSTASYRRVRRGIRDYYREHVPLTTEARAERFLNPGNGWVSRLCFDPRIAVGFLHQLMNAHELSGRLRVLREHKPIAASTRGDRVTSVELLDTETGQHRHVEAPYFIDGTPWGDLLELAGVEHVIGPERQADTGEPHAQEDPPPVDHQAFTVCFAMEHLPGEDHTIDKPPQYERWKALRPKGWPGPLFDWTTVDPETHELLRRPLFAEKDGKSWWAFRRILDRSKFTEGFARSDVTIVNWPHNDYWFGPVIGVDEATRERHLEEGRQLSLSLLYWLQTEAPRADGGIGYPGLRLRGDVVGSTRDGLAPAAYVRETRRLRAEFTVLEQHIAHPLRKNGAEPFDDSVGVGCYRIDLHPTVSGKPYLDIGCWPYQIPLGAMIPIRVENLLPGGKNLGVTHIANGAFRVHPTEWNVGEVAGYLSVFCLERRVTPRAVRNTERLLREFQSFLVDHGVEIEWPRITPV